MPTSLRLAAACLIVACLGATAAAQAPAEAPLPREKLDELLRSTDDIAKTVSAIRGLPIKRPIARGVLSKPEITKRLIERLDEEYTAADIAAEEQAMKRFGLLPPDVDYRETVLALLTEQIAGFYDPKVRELYLADWIAVELQRIVMAHEIGHALQDQSFGLLRFTKPNRENSDEQLARQALIEGDGVALMIEFMMRELGQKVDPWANDTIVDTIGATSGLAAGKLFDQAPLALREALLFPYTGGVRFIAATRRTRPWSDVDAMYHKPPLSTEQVLHPEKYRQGEKPIAVKATPLTSLKAWKRSFFNVFGEFTFAILFRQHGLDKPRADRAAAGWGGDRVAIYTAADDDQRTLALLLSSWDSEADAIEAAAALDEIAPKLGEGTSVERRGRDVLLVVAAPAEIADKLRAEVWAKWKVSR
jgi:hypothetical protein